MAKFQSVEIFITPFIMFLISPLAESKSSIFIERLSLLSFLHLLSFSFSLPFIFGGKAESADSFSNVVPRD